MRYMKNIFQYSIIFMLVLCLGFSLMMLGSAQEEEEEEEHIQAYPIYWDRNVDILTAQNLKVFNLKVQQFDKDEFVAMSNTILEKIEPDPKLRRFAKFENAVEFTDEMKYKLYNKDADGTADNSESFKGFFWQDKLDTTSFINLDTRNGDVIFQNQMQRFLLLPAIKLLSKQEAITKAKDFIKNVELMPADFEQNCELLATYGLFYQEGKDGQYGEKTQRAMTFHFGREIEGIPVEGPGSRIIIQLGHEGRILSLVKKWNDITPAFILKPVAMERTTIGKLNDREQFEYAIQPVAKLEFRKPGKLEMTFAQNPYLSESEVRQAVEELIRHYWESPTSVDVMDIELVYYDRSGEYIQPAYAVELKLHFEDGETMDVLYHVAALRNPPEPIR